MDALETWSNSSAYLDEVLTVGEVDEESDVELGREEDLAAVGGGAGAGGARAEVGAGLRFGFVVQKVETLEHVLHRQAGQRRVRTAVFQLALPLQQKKQRNSATLTSFECRFNFINRTRSNCFVVFL